MRTSILRFRRFRVPAILGVFSGLVLLCSHSLVPGADADSLSKLLAGREFVHTVQKGESLASIGARFGVEAKFIAVANGLPVNSVPREGRQLRIDNRHIVPQPLGDGILINIPQRMLFYFRNSQLLQSYPVGLGRPDWPTPTGRFKIISKEENPVWDVPKSIQEEMRREGKVVQERVPPCPENPLGKHWMGLSIPGYGIHGTVAPTSIYQFRTHGCIRLHPDDIAGLFAEVTAGSSGLIVYQPLVIARLGNQIFLEAHRDIYRKGENLLESLLAAAKRHGLESALDWETAKEIIARQEGVAREVTRGSALRP
jgi:L,D-transpeptidase ErfK/SrfK